MGSEGGKRLRPVGEDLGRPRAVDPLSAGDLQRGHLTGDVLAICEFQICHALDLRSFVSPILHWGRSANTPMRAGKSLASTPRHQRVLSTVHKGC